MYPWTKDLPKNQSLCYFSGDTSASHMAVIKKVVSSNELVDVKSVDSNDSPIKKFAILIHDTDDYVLEPESRLWGDADTNVQQLETLGYTEDKITD